jgi:hypothetical protein
MSDYFKLFAKFAADEQKFLGVDFFSPVLRGKPIRIKINNILMTLKISSPKKFEGWGVFRPASFKEAKFIRKPTMAEKQQYFDLFPELRFILCFRDKDNWRGIPSHLSDSRYKINGLVPIYLVEECQLFDTVQVRFDGNVCWFEKIYDKHTPKNAAYLRDSLNTLLDPKKLDLAGLTQEERDAYVLAYGPAVAASAEMQKLKEEDRLKAALTKAGATYASHVERGNVYTIEYMVEGERHRSTIKKDTLEVQSAGICLSGGDRAFDLQSLVGVVREGQRRHSINRVGDNYDDYDDYD